MRKAAALLFLLLLLGCGKTTVVGPYLAADEAPADSCKERGHGRGRHERREWLREMSRQSAAVADAGTKGVECKH